MNLGTLEIDLIANIARLQRDCPAPYTRPGPPTQAERKRRAAAIERQLAAFL
jgi:hypothetical protein